MPTSVRRSAAAVDCERALEELSDGAARRDTFLSDGVGNDALGEVESAMELAPLANGELAGRPERVQDALRQGEAPVAALLLLLEVGGA